MGLGGILSLFGLYKDAGFQHTKYQQREEAIYSINLEYFLFDKLWFYDIFKVRWKTANANDLSFFKLNCSGVNTPIPKMKIAYTESTALASLYFKVKFLKSLALGKLHPTKFFIFLGFSFRAIKRKYPRLK